MRFPCHRNNFIAYTYSFGVIKIHGTVTLVNAFETEWQCFKCVYIMAEDKTMDKSYYFIQSIKMHFIYLVDHVDHESDPLKMAYV